MISLSVQDVEVKPEDTVSTCATKCLLTANVPVGAQFCFSRSASNLQHCQLL